MSTANFPAGDVAIPDRALLDIARALYGTLDVERLYRRIYREAARVLDVEGFYVSTYDQSRDLATIVFYADRGVERSVEITYRGSDSEVIRTGQASRVADRGGGQSLLVLGDEETEVTRSAISAPMRLNDRILGVISAQNYQPNAFDDQDLELLQLIADAAAAAIDVARHVSELERRRSEAEAIEELGRELSASLDPDEVLKRVVDATLRLLRVEGAAVWAVEGEVARVVQSAGRIELPLGTEWTLGAPLRERLLERRVPVIVQDLAESPLVPASLRNHLRAGSGLAAPLVVAGEVDALLAVGSEDVRAFGEAEVALVGRLARQASVALDNARLNQRLEALSLTDPLTGLANRRHLKMHLEKEIAAARRGRSVSLVMFDLDDFKRHNDALGHLVGDKILVAVARNLADEARASNLVARYGGDEFVAVLSDSSASGTEQYVARIHERVALDPVLAEYGVSVSVGAATFDPDTMSEADDLLRAADVRLYDRKERRPALS